MNFTGINIEFFAIDFEMRSLCFKAKFMAIFFLVIVVIGVIVHDFSSVRFLFHMVQYIIFMMKKWNDSNRCFSQFIFRQFIGYSTVSDNGNALSDNGSAVSDIGFCRTGPMTVNIVLLARNNRTIFIQHPILSRLEAIKRWPRG